jgi:hypothetical protein
MPTTVTADPVIPPGEGPSCAATGYDTPEYPY